MPVSQDAGPVATPRSRVRPLNDAPIDPGGKYVLYWMTSARRTGWNYALQRAVEHCFALRRPLLVLEPLRAGYRWASDRFHRFIIDGMVDNRARCEVHGVAYYPYVEPRDGAGKGLVTALAEGAAAVVCDDYPAFFLPRMIEAAAHRIPVRAESVDSNGLLPMRAAARTFATAHAFRRYLHGHLPAHLDHPPAPDPLATIPRGAPATIPAPILARWPPADLSRPAALVARLPIDHTVGPAVLRANTQALHDAVRDPRGNPPDLHGDPAPLLGGPDAATARLAAFVQHSLARYATDRNHPERDATSGLSPYLHFGHISTHEILHRIAAREAWDPARQRPEAAGRRAGWWGMSESAEAFLDQLVTWRELGFNRCLHVAEYDSYESLPEWARRTLREHAADPREWVYDRGAFEEARTHDPLWNAAQNQLRREGRIHNYLRMLWGKKILEWSESPRTALRVMIELNNRYALDGRDPNSHTGILWVLGLHDRAWGPERPVFGKVRYMSSANTARKFRIRGYVAEYLPHDPACPPPPAGQPPGKRPDP